MSARRTWKTTGLTVLVGWATQRQCLSVRRSLANLDQPTRRIHDRRVISRQKENPMRTPQRPVTLAVAIAAFVTLAFVLFITPGIAGVLLLAFAGLLVANYLAHHHVSTHIGEHHARHGIHMD
jgi:hypothetical protein